MGKGVISLLGEMYTSENIPGEKLKDMVSIYGRMGIYTQDSFLMGRRMDKEAGKRVAMRTLTHIREITSLIRSTVTENSCGLLEASIRVTIKTI